jgi:dGTP triphosphohydrolase
MSVSNILNHNGKVSITYMPSEVMNLMKKVETQEEEIKALRKYIDHMESQIAISQKELKDSVQIDLCDLKERLKHEVLEDVNERLAAMEKKEPGLWDRMRGYFVNKKMNGDLMKQLL